MKTEDIKGNYMNADATWKVHAKELPGALQTQSVQVSASQLYL